jgi:hypothetical protein
MDSIQTASAQAFIRWDPVRTDLTITEAELEKIRSAAYNHWKDLFLLSVPLSISCILNAISATTNPFVLTLPLFLNYLIGVVAILASIAFGMAWRKTRVDLDALLSTIKTKPMYKVEPGQTGAGGTPVVVLKHENGAG